MNYKIISEQILNFISINSSLHIKSKFLSESEVYCGPCQTSMMEFFTKTLKSFQPLTIFAKKFLHRRQRGFQIRVSKRNILPIYSSPSFFDHEKAVILSFPSDYFSRNDAFKNNNWYMYSSCNQWYQNEFPLCRNKIIPVINILSPYFFDKN